MLYCYVTYNVTPLYAAEITACYTNQSHISQSVTLDWIWTSLLSGQVDLVL